MNTKNEQYKIQEKATLNKPKLETRKELKQNKESKTRGNTEKQRAKTYRAKEFTYLQQD